MINRRRLALLLEYRKRQVHSNFWEYRKMINPKLVQGWWQKEIADHLMQFFLDWKAGLRPKLVIQAPPQHGKSTQVVDFVSWVLGKEGMQDTKVMYTSFSDRLGVRANSSLQRILDSDKYKEMFDLRMGTRSGDKAKAKRNSDIVEFDNGEGYFRNTTVRGAITGESLDLGIIDDPIRGRVDANSATIRNACWDWFTNDFFTRFSENAAMLAILTRWHIDDPIGRLIEKDPGIKVLSYPAIATEDEEHRKEGEPLFPEHKSLGFLLERKAVMSDSDWQSLYQQNPYVIGGKIFREEWWQFYKVAPRLKYRIIYGDTAQKAKEENDYSVLQHWGVSEKNQIYLLDQVRGKWEAPELLTSARAFINKSKNFKGGGILRAVKVEDKSSGTGLIQTLKREGMPIVGIQRSTDKVLRANDAVPYIQAGNVFLPEDAPWLSDYLSEHTIFPNGKNDDQIDPTIDAIIDLLSPGGLDYSALSKM